MRQQRQPSGSRPEPARTDVTLDVVGFLLGIGMAWVFDWRTKDLVWGLWLSSLVLGYASLLIGIATLSGKGFALPFAAKVFLVVFFTAHFGLFHFVHSVFLDHFFPVHADGNAGFRGGFGPGLGGYVQVLTSYWPWLIAAGIAERANILPAPQVEERAIEVRTGGVRNGFAAVSPQAMFMVRPYFNVIRMHLLIFFFAGASMAGFDGFLVYLVVYAVYFLPWRTWLRGHHFAGRAFDRQS